jgi:predicted anti-sigma-YlaC factor YlaD
VDDDSRAFEVACQLFVELVTEYLEGTLEPPLDVAMTTHLQECTDCREYLAQIRATISATGRLTVERLGPRAMRHLVTEFHEVLRSPARRPSQSPWSPS